MDSEDACQARQRQLTLLPTPTAQAAKHGTTYDSTAAHPSGNLWNLPHLLPTPTVGNGTGGNLTRGGARSDEVLLPGAVQPERFGAYTAAVARWEAVVGPAPAPTVGGRLNPDFAEWMMGWPVGWTDIGIPRTQRLKIIGNGVVPQQALLALSCFADETIWRHH